MSGPPTTIPAGKMGNEEPILVTSGRWYPPEGDGDDETQRSLGGRVEDAIRKCECIGAGRITIPGAE